MNSNYPPGVTELPHEFDEEKEHIFEIGGEVRVMAYSEEGAKINLKNDIKWLLYEAWTNGDIKINE